VKKYFSDKVLGHRPEKELHNGGFTPAAEIPLRAIRILDVIGKTIEPTDFGWDPILKTHSADYVDFLKRAYADWRAAGRPGDAMPYVFPIRRRRDVALSRIDAELGRYSFDCGTPVTEGACEAAYWSAQCALSGAQAVLQGNFLRENDAKKIAILDVDYHHGNGTQDIFYERSDVLYVSLHADPKTDYPFYWGHADETGDGPGKGFNLNLPLPRGTDWAAYGEALANSLKAVSEYGPDVLIVSYGADTFVDDPISFFKLTTPDYTAMGNQIKNLGIPTLICMEGGYDLTSVGQNVNAFLKGFDA